MKEYMYTYTCTFGMYWFLYTRLHMSVYDNKNCVHVYIYIYIYTVVIQVMLDLTLSIYYLCVYL